MKRLSWRRVNVTLLKLLHLHDSPKKTAAAFAIGIFWGLSPVTPPFLGLQTGMALLCALVFRLNKIAAFIGTFITNPFTFVPVYMFGTYIGSLVLGYDLNIHASTFREFWTEVSGAPREAGIIGELKHHLSFLLTLIFGGTRKAAKAYFVGNFITATVVSVAGYFLTSWLIARYRRLREARRARRGMDS